MSEELMALALKVGFKSRLETRDFVPIKSSMCYFYYLCELQKWLREKHNIDVVVGSTYLGYNVVLWNRNTNKLHHISPVNIAEKYEDALEIGLFQALKLI